MPETVSCYGESLEIHCMASNQWKHNAMNFSVTIHWHVCATMTQYISSSTLDTDIIYGGKATYSSAKTLPLPVSDVVTSIGFLFTTKYSSKLLHLPIRPWQLVSHLISKISSNYTSHHELSVLQPTNFSKYHICLLILVGTYSTTALLQHGIPFLPPSNIVPPYTVSRAT